MLASFLALLAFGFTGSLHCAVMCGPLAANCARDRYFFARLSTYAVLGFAVALLAGAAFAAWLPAAQRILALVAALSLCVSAFRAYRGSTTGPGGFSRSSMARSWDFLRRRSPFDQDTTLGALTGLMPCGFLYAAFLQAAATLNPVHGAVGMAGFALGTTPALWLGARGLRLLRGRSPGALRRWNAGALILAALLTAARGLTPPHVHGEEHDAHHHH